MNTHLQKYCKPTINTVFALLRGIIRCLFTFFYMFILYKLLLTTHFEDIYLINSVFKILTFFSMAVAHCVLRVFVSFCVLVVVRAMLSLCP